MVDLRAERNASCGFIDLTLSNLSMEAAKMNRRSDSSKRVLMLQTWQGLGQPAIGKRELHQIQQALVATFGPAALESPAAIARVLAGEGAQLRHPEVIEFDAEWREAQINREEEKFAALPKTAAREPLTLSQAEALIRSFEALRRQFEEAEDRPAISRLTEQAIEARDFAQSAARNPENGKDLRALQKEICEWFRIWIQTPNLFADWIELRKSSPNFSL